MINLNKRDFNHVLGQALVLMALISFGKLMGMRAKWKKKRMRREKRKRKKRRERYK
ncbi:MAG: hypothetical protein QW186_03560 [Candidatus Bathyarchaeia archaeon]